MSELLKQIENQVLTLPAQERAFLADRLLSSLNEDSFTDNEAEWIIEAEKRYKEYKNGKRKGVSAEKVFEEAEKIK
ncbi:MAG: addiction module protein [Desulfobacteraceae bacterium]|jgi:putative addiction module component (TIGR02574 family)